MATTPSEASSSLPASSSKLLDEVEPLLKRGERLVRDGRALLKRPETDAPELAGLLRGLLEVLEPLAAATKRARDLAAEADEAAQLGLLRLDADLRDACRDRGWRVDGQWPTLYVAKAIRVDFDERKGTVSVGEHRIRPATLPRIMTVLETIVPGLLSAEQPAGHFMSLLATSWRKVAGQNGGPARIWDVYKSFVVESQSPRFWRDARAERFSPLSTEQFRARLADALEHHATRLPDGSELRLLPPLDPDDALFVFLPGEERFGYVGRVEFIPVEAVDQ